MPEVTKEEVKEAGVNLKAVNREDHELPSSAFGAKVTHDKDGNPTKVELAHERRLVFDKPGKRVGAKRLYTVKAQKPDGSLIQIPLEGQINNNVASPENFLGLRYYEKKGFQIFFDYDTGKGEVCPSWDCWAQWNDLYDGFCCQEHKDITKPNKGDGAFGAQATTSASVWGV